MEFARIGLGYVTLRFAIWADISCNLACPLEINDIEVPIRRSYPPFTLDVRAFSFEEKQGSGTEGCSCGFGIYTVFSPPRNSKS